MTWKIFKKFSDFILFLKSGLIFKPTAENQVKFQDVEKRNFLLTHVIKILVDDVEKNLKSPLLHIVFQIRANFQT